MYVYNKESSVVKKDHDERDHSDESLEYSPFSAPGEYEQFQSRHRVSGPAYNAPLMIPEKKDFPDELSIAPGELTREYLAAGTVLYKSMRYDSFDAAKALAGRKNTEEWEGQYFALDKAISEGYEMDYLDEDTGNGRAWLHTFVVTKDIPILHNTAPHHGDDSYSGGQKAAAVKRFLINNPDILVDNATAFINPGKPLMPTLSEMGVAFNGPHDMDGGREIIIGGEQLKDLNVTHSESHQYKMWERR
ncbi:MAG: hypothetical protein ACRCTP_07350 [Aeromonas popoffii]|jgi:hypothetical protein|uniref:hypothetical protein n=1 Tax=Aeromonas popoffii TaxID=70856 RepID=UPI003F40E5EA